MYSLFHCSTCGQLFDEHARKPYSGTECSHSICALCFKDRTSDNCECGKENAFTNATINYQAIELMKTFENNLDVEMFLDSVENSASGLCSACKSEHGKLYVCVDCCRRAGMVLDDNLWTLKINLEQFLSKAICSNCACDSHDGTGHRVQPFSKMMFTGQTDEWKRTNLMTYVRLRERQIEQETYVEPWGDVVQVLKLALLRNSVYRNALFFDFTGNFVPLRNRIMVYQSIVANEYYEEAKRFLNDPTNENQQEEYLKVVNELKNLREQCREFSMKPEEIAEVDKQVAELFQKREETMMVDLKPWLELNGFRASVWKQTRPHDFKMTVITNEINALVKFNNERPNTAKIQQQFLDGTKNYTLHGVEVSKPSVIEDTELLDAIHNQMDAMEVGLEWVGNDLRMSKKQEQKANEWQLLIRLMILEHFPNSPRNTEEECQRVFFLEDKFSVLYRDEERAKQAFAAKH